MSFVFHDLHPKLVAVWLAPVSATPGHGASATSFPKTHASPGMDFQGHTLGLLQAPRRTHTSLISGQPASREPSTCSREGAQDQRHGGLPQAEGNGEGAWDTRVPSGLGPVSDLPAWPKRLHDLGQVTSALCSPLCQEYPPQTPRTLECPSRARPQTRPGQGLRELGREDFIYFYFSFF